MSGDEYFSDVLSDSHACNDEVEPSQSISQAPASSEISTIQSSKPKAAPSTKSWIWQYTLYSFHQKISDSDGSTLWSCGTCKKHYKYSSGTGKGIKHLATHGITEHTTRQKRIKPTQEHVDSLFSNTVIYPSTGRRTLEAGNADLSLDILE